MSNKTVFIKLTPESLFFFGGEQGITADYYLKGNFIPQQTALLGLLRHQILIQNKLLKDNKIENDAEAIIWIGASSFNPKDESQQFGKIEKISPCYLVVDGKKHLPYIPDYLDELKSAGGNIYFPKHDPKKRYSVRWKSTEDNSFRFESELYEEVERIGVDKNYAGKTQNKSFYKQVWLKMTKGVKVSFAFYASIDQDVSLENADVTFGKESAPFKMEVLDIDESKFKDDSDANAILLTSDAFSGVDLDELCTISVSNVIPFRNLNNKTSADHRFYSLNKHQEWLQLYKRGSVFIPKDPKDFKTVKTLLDEHKNFRNIGYNHYCQIKLNY